MATLGTPQAALIRRKSSTIGVGRTDYIQSPPPSLRTEPYRTEPAVLPHTALRSVGLLWGTEMGRYLTDCWPSEGK